MLSLFVYRKLVDHRKTRFWDTNPASWPARGFSARFWKTCGITDQRKNRMKALLYPLWSQLRLCLLPGPRGIGDDGTCQEKHPTGQGGQDGELELLELAGVEAVLKGVGVRGLGAALARRHMLLPHPGPLPGQAKYAGFRERGVASGDWVSNSGA
jgi:hypothetical protein